jgi:L-ornithine Nalpha-acyltransferase
MPGLVCDRHGEWEKRMILSPRRLVSKFRPRALRGMPPITLPFRNKRGKRIPIIPIGRMPKIYGRIGNLEVRLARSRGDLRRAQKLRYEVFYEEMDAIPNAAAMISRRDEDPYDEMCDHLLVVDHGDLVAGRNPWKKRPRVVGTYRVLRQDMAERHGGFYTQGEYNIAPLLAMKSRDNYFMELGRSCVLKPYRNRRTVELLWHGVWTYCREHGVDVMIGCASFPGIDPKRHAMALSYLHHNAMAPKEWRVKAHDRLFVNMNMMNARDVDPKAAFKAMPPLIKGYLRLGAYIGEGAVVDRQFGTTDVLIILPVEAIDSRYFGHFGAPDETSSALMVPGGKALI